MRRYVHRWYWGGGGGRGVRLCGRREARGCPYRGRTRPAERARAEEAEAGLREPRGSRAMFLPQRRSVAAEAMTGPVSSSITQQREQGAASCCSARGAARLGTEGRHSYSPLRPRAPCVVADPAPPRQASAWLVRGCECFF